ncbi:MAG: YigZ family protein [Clostridia bacterium]|nr:YigZ family protein [Clostridia bacterium]
MKLYSTISQRAEVEQTIEKSRFIAHIMPVESKEEADIEIAKIRKKYWDATHNVPALVLGDKMQVKWASDDGEPSGTSGVPMLNVLASEGVTNVLVVVTRYFGGVKLGTGGLARAYSSSAKLALEKAGVCDVKEVIEFTYRTEYSYLAKIQNLDIVIDSIDYDDMVNIHMLVDPENYQQTLDALSNVTSGKGTVLKAEKVIKKY